MGNFSPEYLADLCALEDRGHKVFEFARGEDWVWVYDAVTNDLVRIPGEYLEAWYA